MLHDIISNDKAKFMTSYSKLANELDSFTALNKLGKSQNQSQSQSRIQKKENFLNKEKRINFMLMERLKNNKQEAKNILAGKNSISKISFNNNIEDLLKNENWKNLKNPITEIKPINYSNNNNDYSSKNLYEKIRTNLNEMRRQFNLEETFQKNNNLLENKVISPRNNMIYVNKNPNRKNYFSLNKNAKNFGNIRNIVSNEKDFGNFFNFNNSNSNKINSTLKNKFNFFYEITNNNNNNNDIENYNSINTNNYYFNNSEK